MHAVNACVGIETARAARNTGPMRVLAGVCLAAMTVLLAGWTLSSERGWNPQGGAVVKTPDRVSHVIRASGCDGIPHPGRLRFGGTPIDSDLPYMSLVVRAREGKPAVLDVIDGVLRLAPGRTLAVLGTARTQDALGRRGTFVLFKHLGAGALGKRYTGSFNCGRL